MASKWTSESIRSGIDRFIIEQGRPPTARDFDEANYLPSARQIQRAYGGLVSLRQALGYSDLDFTKGELRKVIITKAGKRGVTAEDNLEPLLVAQFGEPFVHVQKRYYKGSRSRYDFFVYARDAVFGVDTFTTDRAAYIEKNLRHKVLRYKDVPAHIQIYFVLVGADFTKEDVERAKKAVSQLQNYPNMIALHETEFLRVLHTYQPLQAPAHFKSIAG